MGSGWAHILLKAQYVCIIEANNINRHEQVYQPLMQY